MFGLRLTTKRELALQAATMLDMRREIARLNERIDHEQKRAEAAINLLLLKTQRAVLTPDQGMTMVEEETMRQNMMDVFNDADEPVKQEAKKLEELQS